MNGGNWIPPKVQKIRKLPFLPNEAELDQLIGGAFKKLAVFLQLLKETGLRSGEAWRLKWIDINSETGILTLNDPEKHGNPRMLKLNPNLISMLNKLPKNNERIFNGDLTIFRRTFRRYKKRMAQKL